MTSQNCMYKGGRHRPENATATSYPPEEGETVERGTCQKCGRFKWLHDVFRPQEQRRSIIREVTV